MSRRPRNASRIGQLVGVIAVGVLAAGAIALTAAALRHGDALTPSGTPAPAPTFRLGVETAPTPSPTVTTPTADPIAASPGANERFLSVGSGGMWRATAGECGVTDPVVERSTDGGASWTDVTPTYRGIEQVHSLDAFAGTEAEMIAAMGDGCELELLRTFTQGEFWEPYPEIFATATRLSSTSAGAVITPEGELLSPCDDARSLRATGDAIALICDGVAYRLVEHSWVELTTAAPAALTIADGDVIVAHAETGCPGLGVTRFGATVTFAGCLDTADPAIVALAARGASIVAWSGTQITTIGD